MNRVLTRIQTTITTEPELSRCLSITTVMSRKKKNSCEETDCCGNPINVQPKPKIVLERTCNPCSFFTWKPKIPILECAPPLADIVKKKPFKKKHCYAGMKFKEKSLEEIKKEAAECEKKCKAVPDCSVPPPPPVIKKPDCSDPIPTPDWDINADPPKPEKECPCE